MASLLKQLATNPSTGTLRALCPGDSRASRSRAKPSLIMVQQNWSSQSSRGWSHRCNWMWQVGPRISWLTQGLPTLSWPPTPEPSPLEPVTFWVSQEKQLQKGSPEYLLLGWTNIFTSFWWSLSVLLPYWEEIFPCLRNLAAIAVLIEDAQKTLSWEQTNYFYLPSSETTHEWERPFMDIWSRDPQVSSSADGKSRPDYISLWGS